jgi:copper chaperone CopZ
MATTVTYTIPNISCGHCVHTIKSPSSPKLEGVQSVDADQVTKQTTITYGPRQLKMGSKLCWQRSITRPLNIKNKF